MTYLEPRKDIIKLSILVMESLLDTKVKEKFLMSIIQPKITIMEKQKPFNIKDLEEQFRK